MQLLVLLVVMPRSPTSFDAGGLSHPVGSVAPVVRLSDSPYKLTLLYKIFPLRFEGDYFLGIVRFLGYNLRNS